MLNKVADQVRQDTYRASDWTLASHDLGIGILSVLSRRRHGNTQLVASTGQSDPRNLIQEDVEVVTSVSLIVKSAKARHAIKVDTRQTYSYDGVFSAIPRLFVNNVLPADSPVFSIVRRGLLQEFQTLLREGKASLRDQDENGAPLLFVSLFCCLLRLA